MHYTVSARKLLDVPNWHALHGAAHAYDQRMAEETFALVLDAFHTVGVLQSLTLAITPDGAPSQGLSPPGFTCKASAKLRAVPSRLVVPQLDRHAPPVDVVAEFTKRGGVSDEQFVAALGSYFDEVWPAFNDRAHLFGGVGTVTVERRDIQPLLEEGVTVNLEEAVKAFQRHGNYKAATQSHHAFAETLPGTLDHGR